MHHLKPLLLSSLVAATLGASPALAQVDTQSTPVPQSLLNVKDNLEQSLSSLSTTLASSANRLDHTGDHLALCGAGTPEAEDGDSPADFADYLECHTSGLDQLGAVYRDTAAGMREFADSLNTVKAEIQQVKDANASWIKSNQQTLRRYELAADKITERLTQIARSIPSDQTLDRNTRRQVERLRIEFLDTAQHRTLITDSLADAQADQDALHIIDDAIDAWQHDAGTLAYQYSLNDGVVQRTQGNIARKATTQAIFSQLDFGVIGHTRDLLAGIGRFSLDKVITDSRARNGARPEDPAPRLIDPTDDDLGDFLAKFR